MRYPLYFSLHITGAFLVLIVLAILAFQFWNGVDRQEVQRKKLLISCHLVGTFLILLGGMGLMKLFNISHGGPYPSYLIIKGIIWGILGLGTFIVYKFHKWAHWIFLVFILLAVVSGYSGKFKRQFFETAYDKPITQD